MSRGGNFLGFHSADGTYASEISEERLTSVFRLFREMDGDGRDRFPDFAPVIRHINRQIEDGFASLQQQMYGWQLRQQETALAKNYELLFDQWNYASSLEEGERKEKQWDEVVKNARPLLIDLRDAMPPFADAGSWDIALVEKTALMGRMYIEVLLFFIYARAAYEQASLGRDHTLLKDCRALKEKVEAQLAGSNGTDLMLSAAFHRPDAFEKVSLLAGRTPDEAYASIVADMRSLPAHQVKDPNSFIPEQWQGDEGQYIRTVTTVRYSDLHWNMISVLWIIHHRVSHLESLLASLAERGNKVDFRYPGAEEMMERLLAKTLPGSDLLALPGPDDAAAPPERS